MPRIILYKWSSIDKNCKVRRGGNKVTVSDNSFYCVCDLRVHVCWVAKCVSGVAETFEDIYLWLY